MDNIVQLAPVGIATYSRLSHLKKTVESLQQNTLATQSELYIFSDAPKKCDEEIVLKIRKYIHTIKGFKKVNIIERETNDMLKNCRGGMIQLLDEYGRVIFMEDDNVTGPGFLKFMNDALNFYKGDKKIFAINGYNIPTNYPENYTNDYYLSLYFNGWGFATWKDRGIVDYINGYDQYREVIYNKNLLNKIRRYHPKLIDGLKLIHEGKLEAGDYKITFNLLKDNLYVIKPICSLVRNIGHDGTGANCGMSTKYDINKLNSSTVKFVNDVEYIEELDLIWRKYIDKKDPVLKRISNKIKRIIG